MMRDLQFLFLVDAMLGNIARKLQLFGFDSKYVSDADDLKLIEQRFTLLMKINKIEEVEKLTSNLLVKAKSVFYTEIS